MPSRPRGQRAPPRRSLPVRYPRPCPRLSSYRTPHRLLPPPPLLAAAQVLRSEIVEKLLGKVLYEGIFEFVQRADLLGNIFAQLPLLGAIRMQMLKTARSQLDAVLGDSLARFLGEYTASAAESASAFLVSPETASARRRARRSAAAKLLAKPVRDLVQISDIEMALVRDAAWSAIQEFRLPHEEVRSSSGSGARSSSAAGSSAGSSAGQRRQKQQRRW